MANMQKVGTHRTTVTTTNGKTAVTYHYTKVVEFGNEKIVLDTGGWFSATTKTRMNQTSNQFDLGFYVYQDKGEWFVNQGGEVQKFTGDKLVLYR